MHPRCIVGAGLRSPAHALARTRVKTGTPFATTCLQQRATCALATAIAAEADDQRVMQRIKGRQTERFR